MRVAPSVAILSTVFIAACFLQTARAEGIGTLIEAGKSMDSAKKELSAETSGFENVKNAIALGALKKGASRDAVAAQYGQPVVKNDDYATSRERWVYKPARSSFFDGPRIYLYFAKSGSLDEIKVLE